MDMMSVVNILNVVIPCVVFIGAGLILVYGLLKRKGLIKSSYKAEKEKDNRKGKRISVQKFNVVEDFRDNCVITEGGNKFVMGLMCTGVSIDKVSYVERKIVEDNFIGYINMIDWDVQFYIQSRKMDVESNIKYLEETKELLKDEYDKVISQYQSTQTIIKNNPSRAEAFNEEKIRMGDTIRVMEWQNKHIEEEIAYAKAVASPDSDPQFDLYIIYSYIFDSSAYTTQLTNDEIYQKAIDDLEIKLNNTKGVLKRCMVECQVLGREHLAAMLYRSYNLCDADIVDFKDVLKTASFDLYNKTDYFQESKLKYIAETLKSSANEEMTTGGGISA